MPQSVHMGILRIVFHARPLVDSDASAACEDAVESLSHRNVEFARSGIDRGRPFVEVESKKVPITMRILREKGFSPSIDGCVERPTVTFPRLIRILLTPRQGRTIEEEHGRALDDLIVAGLYPFGSSLGVGPDWGTGCATFDVEDFNLEATLEVLHRRGYQVDFDQ